MPKPLYLRLINLSSVAVFDETLDVIRSAGPSSSLPGHFEAHVPVPGGTDRQVVMKTPSGLDRIP